MGKPTMEDEEKSWPVRSAMVEGERLFLLPDVARALGMKTSNLGRGGQDGATVHGGRRVVNAAGPLAILHRNRGEKAAKLAGKLRARLEAAMRSPAQNVSTALVPAAQNVSTSDDTRTDRWLTV